MYEAFEVRMLATCMHIYYGIFQMALIYSKIFSTQRNMPIPLMRLRTINILYICVCARTCFMQFLENFHLICHPNAINV